MKVLGNVIKSVSDKRTYKAIQLDNQLQCLIISDQEAQKSSAALSVGVGSLVDPVQAQGLAHYLEHMLFMGTQKYPQENDYMNYISKNSGSSNAYTSQTQTNYHFQVASIAFQNTLDRFAQFFICPLMLQSSSERQLNAVHSEHSKNLQNDAWRKFQITKHLAKEGHPYGKFSTGDKDSLANPDLRKMLFDFYNKHYSANLMKLVIYGKESVDKLGQWVVQYFSGIPNKNYTSYVMQQPPFDNKSLKKLIKITPVQDRRTLQLTWILPDKSSHYHNAPSKYVSHIIGHQGKGSLLSYLISEGLANSLSAGGEDSYDCYSEFQINLGLTDKGFDNIQRVIAHVLFAIDQLQKAQPEKWIFQEVQNIYKMKFDYLEKKQGISYVSGLVKRLHKRTLQQVLYYPYAMEQWKPEIISEYLNELKTDNLIVICENKKYQGQTELTQPIYKTKYTTKQLGQISEQACSFVLPQKNIFIPQDLSIHPLGQSQHPILLSNQRSPYISPYFKGDHHFSLPKSQINLRFYFSSQNSVKNDVCRKLFQQMINQYLREFSYMAETAELNSELSFGSYFTINIKINGFRDSISRFTKQYIQKIINFLPQDQKLFETRKEKLTKTYANQLLKNPYQIAYQNSVSAIRVGSSHPAKKKLQMIASIAFDDVKSFAVQWKKKLYAQILISGNMQEALAIQIINNIQNTMKSQSQALSMQVIPQIRSVNLVQNSTIILQQTLFSISQTNNSIIVHFQSQPFTPRIKVLQDLIQSFVKQPAFDYLRTKQQLGYIVMSLPDDNRGVMGMSLLLQSNVKTTNQLAQYVDVFVNQVLKQLIHNLNQQVFDQYINAILSTKRQNDKNLSCQSLRFWTQIVKHKFLFNRKQQELKIIPTITLEQFKTFINSIFYQNVKRFEIHQIAQVSLEKNDQVLKQRIQKDKNIKVYKQLDVFRQNTVLYADFYKVESQSK